jgi:exopolysaccharide biosynthesis polyprenyl glycosylphosphotransferase
MLKERARIVAGGLLIVDLLLVVVAFFLSFWLRNDLLPAIGLIPSDLYPLRLYLPLLPIVLLIWGSLTLSFHLYHSQRTTSLRVEIWDIMRVSIAGTLLLALAIFLFQLDKKLLGSDQISRLWILLFVATTFLFLSARMVTVRLTARWVRAHGYNYRTVLVAGTNATAKKIARTIENHPHWGFSILGFVSEDADLEACDIDPGLLLGQLDDIADIVEENVVDEVIFALGLREFNRLENLLLQLEEQGVRTRLALDLFPHARAQVQIGTLEELPLLTYSTTPTSELRLLAKRTMDIGISLLVLGLALPAMLVIALAIKMASGGKVLYRQTRCGLYGRKFTLFKFRTMVEDAEQLQEELSHLNEMRGPVFKMKEDPRITPLGRWLRRLSLDELPQLWNVLKGDMSLVGPRPPVPREVSSYERWQRRRLSMRPGLTCLWQIRGRNDIDFESWMQLDLEYIDNWSPMLDVKILAKTIPAVLSGRGAS